MTDGIDRTIERVENLYRAVTGLEPPPPGPIAAPGDVEAATSLRMDRLIGMLEARWMPAVSVSGGDREVVVRADLPGVSRQEVSAELSGDVLLLCGARRSGAPADGRPGERETPAGPFVRALRLPGGARADRVTARLVDGVLEVRVPYQPSRPECIEVA